MKFTVTSALGVTVGLLLATAAGAWLTPDIKYTGRVCLRTDALPAEVPGYMGLDILSCQNLQCRVTFTVEELAGAKRCPRCGGELNPVSASERGTLPPDTRILKKFYRSASGDTLAVTVVFSTENQRSIHRPQRCLPAQGFVIERSRVIAVPMRGGRSLDVCVLDVRPGLGTEAKPGRSGMTYAYWYAGGNYETAGHFDRLARTAADRIFRNKLDRWAYVSVMVTGSPGSDPTPTVMGFIADLYPLIHRDADVGR